MTVPTHSAAQTTHSTRPPRIIHGLPAMAALSALAGIFCIIVSAERASAQEEIEAPPAELTAPPRYEERPGEVRLAPQPEERREALEEIVVIGGDVWRLPDLGSALRADREAEEAGGRWAASFLPLYDPEDPPNRRDLLRADSELDRVGFIELFRIRFGGRRGRE